MPPPGEVIDLFVRLLLPAMAASVIVMALLRRLGGERFAPLAAALALAVGVLVGNYFREAMPWRLDSERSLTGYDLATVLGWSLEQKPTGEIEDTTDLPPLPPSRYWLPWLAGLALLVELLVRLPAVTPSMGWILRTGTVLLAGRLLTPPDLRVATPWASWALAAAMLLIWMVLKALARQWKDATLPTALALCFAAAGMVLLHAHSARLADMALLGFAALFGIAVTAWLWPGDVAGALGAVAVFLPGLMLTGQQETFSEVPFTSFLLVALAPVALLPMTLPLIAQRQRWSRWLPGLILPLIPAGIAVYLAMQAESLPF